MYLGDLIVKRAPGLEWRFFDKGKKTRRNKSTTKFILARRPLGGEPHAHRLLNDAAEGEDDFFMRLVESAVSKPRKQG